MNNWKMGLQYFTVYAMEECFDEDSKIISSKPSKLQSQMKYDSLLQYMLLQQFEIFLF